MKTAVVAGVFLAFASCVFLGCNKSEQSATNAAPGSTAKPSVPLRDQNGRLTKAGLDAAWSEVFMAPGRVNEPVEKKKTMFEGKVGKPVEVEGNYQIWYAVDGSDCYRVELGKDGTKGAGKVAASKCGA